MIDEKKWFSQIEPAQVVACDSEIEWAEDIDVLVVGCGAAGLSAALQAREAGLNVMIAERFAGGGTTLMSGGVIYAGGGTQVQKQLGEDDSPAAMFEYLQKETQGVVADETLMRFCEESPNTIDWLSKHGVKFSGPVWKQKTSYPQVKYFLYHSDNSLLSSHRGKHPPAARGHRGVIKQGNSAVNLGGSITSPLMQSAREFGIELSTWTEIRQMVINEKGEVLGAKALKFDETSAEFKTYLRLKKWADSILKVYPTMLPGGGLSRRLSRRWRKRAAEIETLNRKTAYLRAHKGVVLAGGGFIFNRKMVAEYCPKYQRGMPLGSQGDDGGAIRLGQSVGGSARLMDRATAWRFINPPFSWSRGMIVNSRGERFVNESSYGATIGHAMVEYQEGRAWLVLDSALVKAAWREVMLGKVLPFQRHLTILNHLFVKKKFTSLEKLAQHFGFDLKRLESSLLQYTELARSEREDKFGKSPDDAAQLQAPFHVIDISLAQPLLPCTVLTMGGLSVNEASGQVLDGQGAEIKGLYAAGRCAVGIPSNLYMSGLSIADGVFSGRRAARHLASLVR